MGWTKGTAGGECLRRLWEGEASRETRGAFMQREFLKSWGGQCAWENAWSKRSHADEVTALGSSAEEQQEREGSAEVGKTDGTLAHMHTQ